MESTNMLSDLMAICVEGSLDDVKNYFQAEAQAISDNESLFKERDLYQKSVVDKMAMLGKGDVLRFLIQSGFGVNEKSAQGYTPLHHAACWGHIPCIKELYFAGADLSMVNFNAESPRDCAMRYGQQAAVDFLDKAGAQVELKNAAKNFKDIISDPERNMGKLNKEDRITGNRACDEKIDWMENYKETASVTQIQNMKAELEEFMRPIMAKIEDPSGDGVRSNRSFSKAGSTK